MLRWITTVFLGLVAIKVIANICELLNIYGQSELPSGLSTYFISQEWRKARRYALITFTFRSLAGLASLPILYWIIHNKNISNTWRNVEIFLSTFNETGKMLMFWAWWILVGYMYEAIGVNVAGWQVNRPIYGRHLGEVPLIVAAEVVLAWIFVQLARKCRNKRLFGAVIFAIVGIVGWIVWKEIELMRLLWAPQLMSALSLKQAESVSALLRAQSFPTHRIILADVQSAAYSGGILLEYILYNPSIKYASIREAEAAISYALGYRKQHISTYVTYIHNSLYWMMRSAMAFSLLGRRDIMLKFGFHGGTPVIATLAVGDFLMSSVRYALEPINLFLSRYAQRKADEYVRSTGYGDVYTATLLRSEYPLTYQMCLMYELLCSDAIPTRKRITP